MITLAIVGHQRAVWESSRHCAKIRTDFRISSMRHEERSWCHRAPVGTSNSDLVVAVIGEDFWRSPT